MKRTSISFSLVRFPDLMLSLSPVIISLSSVMDAGMVGVVGGTAGAGTGGDGV
jgi:hypothetical protein